MGAGSGDDEDAWHRAGLADGCVRRIASCRLVLGPDHWPFAQARQAEIAAHWERRRRENPKFFNGEVHVLLRARIEGDCLCGVYARTDFASSLYWRETGYQDLGVLDGFGSAILRSREGDVLLGRQSAGNVNAGQAYLPGGFLDAGDVSADGRIGIEGSIVRELQEETGLDAALFVRQPGFLITRAGPLLSIGIEYHADVSTQSLQERIEAFLAAQAAPELDGIIFAGHAAEPGDVQVPVYTQQILRHLLA